MTCVFQCSEIEQFIKAYSGQTIGISCNGVVNLDLSVSILGVKIGIEATANNVLTMNVKKGTIAGINFTSLVRKKFFNFVQAFNCPAYSFYMSGDNIVLKVVGVNFTNISTVDQIVLGIEL